VSARVLNAEDESVVVPLTYASDVVPVSGFYYFQVAVDLAPGVWYYLDIAVAPHKIVNSGLSDAPLQLMSISSLSV
jgi:hypothetical protein